MGLSGFKCRPVPPGGFADTLYDKQRVSAAIKTLRRRSTFLEALRGTNLHPLWTGLLTRGEPAYEPGPDEEVVDACGLRIAVGKWLDPLTKRQARARIEFPPAGPRREAALARLHALYLEAIEEGTGFGEHQMGADEVLAIKLPNKDREVMIPHLVHRILHRALGGELSRGFERPADSFAHRPGISIWHALAQVRLLTTKQGWFHAARVDISQFFPSTSLDLVEEALASELPGLDPGIVRLIRWLYTVNIVRRPSRPDLHVAGLPSWEKERGRLLAGTGLAPILSEIVAAYLLDRKFAHAFAGRARMLRYSDDMLIISDDPGVVVEALAWVRDAVAGHYALHPKKTDKAPTDLRDVALKWLGRYVWAGGVATPRPKLNGLLEELPTTELGSRAHRRVGRAILRALTLDPPDVVRDVFAVIELDAPAWLPFIKDLQAGQGPRRNRLLNRLNHPKTRKRSKRAQRLSRLTP